MNGPTLILCVIGLAFLYFSFSFSKPAKAKSKDDDVSEIDDGEVSGLSLVATRESFDDVVSRPASAPQKKTVTEVSSAPRGATRIKPKAVEIDYSVYDAPAYLRHGIQLSI